MDGLAQQLFAGVTGINRKVSDRISETAYGYSSAAYSAPPSCSSVNSIIIMFSFLLSSSHSKVTWPRHPAQLPVLSRGSFENPDSEETISLRRLIETRCPSVLTPFKPPWWLFKYVLDSSCFFLHLSPNQVVTCRPRTQHSATLLEWISLHMTGTPRGCCYYFG